MTTNQLGYLIVGLYGVFTGMFFAGLLKYQIASNRALVLGGLLFIMQLAVFWPVTAVIILFDCTQTFSNTPILDWVIIRGKNKVDLKEWMNRVRVQKDQKK